MKKLIFLFLLVAGFITAVGLWTESNEGKRPFASPTPTAYEVKTVYLGDKELKVEVADSEAKRKRGLSGRAGIGENDGLLFVFDQENTRPKFWMKEMRFSIDIIWINDGKVVQIDKEVAPPEEGTRDKSLKLYAPNQPIDLVLEVEAGFSDKFTIKEGTTFSFK